MTSFTDPDTHFSLVEGDRPGEPTGEVRCVECGRVAENVDEIPHARECPQRWVRSRWWAEHLREE